MNKQLKKLFFSNISSKGTKGPKSFWKVCKPLFSQKVSLLDERVSLIESDHVINDDSKVTEIFNNYFVNITSSPPIVRIFDLNVNSSISSIIEAYGDHPSIVKIKNQCSIDNFDFPHIESWEVVKLLENLIQENQLVVVFPLHYCKWLLQNVVMH